MMDEKKKKKVIDDESLDQVTGGESSDAPTRYVYTCPDCNKMYMHEDPNLKICAICQSKNVHLFP